MKTKVFALVLIAGLAGLVAGCVDTVDGHSHVGVPFVKDSIEHRYERSVPQCVDAARAVIKFNGALTGDNSVNNSITGRVNQKDVWVKVTEVDPAKPVSSVTVQVRGGADDVDLAADLQTQIALQLQGRR